MLHNSEILNHYLPHFKLPFIFHNAHTLNLSITYTIKDPLFLIQLLYYCWKILLYFIKGDVMGASFVTLKNINFRNFQVSKLCKMQSDPFVANTKTELIVYIGYQPPPPSPFNFKSQ